MAKKRPQPSAFAERAAKIMLEQGVRDFGLAKRKAAQQLSLDKKAEQQLNNTDIVAAIARHQQAVNPQGQAQQLFAMRQTAAEAMQALREFQPVLVGETLTGPVYQFSEVRIHVFTDQLELFEQQLAALDIPYDLRQKPLKIDKRQHLNAPVYEFIAGKWPMQLVVLPLRLRYQRLMSPVDNNPMQQADLKQVKRLLI